MYKGEKLAKKLSKEGETAKVTQKKLKNALTSKNNVQKGKHVRQLSPSSAKLARNSPEKCDKRTYI